MNRITKYLWIAGAVFMMWSCCHEDVNQKVDDLYDRMSQEERIAQLHGIYLEELHPLSISILLFYSLDLIINLVVYKSTSL